MWARSSKHVACVTFARFPLCSVLRTFTSCHLIDESCAQVLKVPQGGYLLQNGANSVLGKQLIALAKKRGVKTINIVRTALSMLSGMVIDFMTLQPWTLAACFCMSLLSPKHVAIHQSYCKCCV